MMTETDRKTILSRIIELELENTDLISKGHKAAENDSFQPKRTELTMLRCVYFGYNSKYCRIKKGFHGTPFS